MESIQIWTRIKTPDYYCRFVPPASEIGWIAVVDTTVIKEFRQHLLVNGYQVGINIFEYPLPDTSWLFYARS